MIETFWFVRFAEGDSVEMTEVISRQ